MRDAADFVCAFAHPADAERCYHVLGRRLKQVGRARSAAKTRLIPCSRHRQAGNMSVEFLGCECRWGKERTGQEHLKRRTARQKRRTALQRCTAWCQENRPLRLPGLFQRLNGHSQLIEADTVIRQTGTLPWSSLPLRRPAPYL